MPDLKFFIDFDGTVTRSDAVDLILDRFASNDWKKVEEEWSSGKIGSRECLLRQMALVTATPEDIEQLASTIEVDPSFLSFVKKAVALNIPLAIVSDGFDFVIEKVLARTFKNDALLLKALPLFSNKLKWEKGHTQLAFPEGPVCKHGCANCKERVIKSLKKEKDFVVFIGDGLSDRFAAKVADLTFAKGKLSLFCKEQSIVHKNYNSFKEIEVWLSEETSKKYSPAST